MADKLPLSERLSRELVHANKMGDSDLAALLREAAEMARRVEDAGVGEVVAGRANSYGGFHVEVAHDAGWHSGQRVRLVPEPTGQEGSNA